MIQAPDLPLWAAILVGLFVLSGATFALIGSIGLLRFQSFYERVHPPTLGTTLGALLIILGSVVCYSVLQTRLLLHEFLIAGFVALTTPVSLMLLARAAIYRDRMAGQGSVPAHSERRPADETREASSENSE